MELTEHNRYILDHYILEITQKVSDSFSSEQENETLINRFIKGYVNYTNIEIAGFGTSIDLENYYFEEFIKKISKEEIPLLIDGIVKHFQLQCSDLKRRTSFIERQIEYYSKLENISDEENEIEIEGSKIVVQMFKNNIAKFEGDIEYYKSKKSLFETQMHQDDKDSNLPSIIPNQKNIKIMLMYELGIFEHLESTYKDLNPNKLGQVIESFTGINQETIKQTYREIIGQRGDSPFNDAKKVSELNKIKIDLKLNKKG